MKTILGALALSLGLVAQAFAQEAPVDPRALEFCRSETQDFTQLHDCLPGADISIAVLDAFQRIYPPEAAPLLTRCVEINEGDPIASSSCVRIAAKKAVALKTMLPAGIRLDDPVFDAVSDPGHLAAVDEARSAARAKYDDVPLFGGMYTPYR